jgi:hypothetical protein
MKVYLNRASRRIRSSALLTVFARRPPFTRCARAAARALARDRGLDRPAQPPNREAWK